MIDDLGDTQGELAYILEVRKDGQMSMVGYKEPKNGEEFEQEELIAAYLAASIDSVEYTDQELHTLHTYLQEKVGKVESVKVSAMYERLENLSTRKKDENIEKSDLARGHLASKSVEETSESIAEAISLMVGDEAVKKEQFIGTGVSRERLVSDMEWKKDGIYSSFAGKKYKPVALKVKPLIEPLPEKYRIIRDIKGDPLKDMPELPVNPPDFEPKGRYTMERMKQMDEKHEEDFMWPEERKLMHHMIAQQNEAFAWDDSERGKFKEEYFPPVEMPVREHTPWVLKNGKIPPGIYDEVTRLLKVKLEAAVYEPSNAPYRSRYFCVKKKDGSLRIVHSLEPLNAVTIAHSGLPPATEELAEQFSGYSCGAICDLYVGYDERLLSETSRDMTTFQTPFGALRLVTLPMGWTNSVPIFHDDVTYILREEIPHVTRPYIDDVPVKGPKTRYELPGGGYETIPENKGIRRFIWEHLQNMNRILQRIKYSGATFSGKKSYLCCAEFVVVGHRCTYEGRKPEVKRMESILNWGDCDSVTAVKAFIGTCGLCRVFIKDFAKIAGPLNKLTKKQVPFEWTDEQRKAMQEIKDRLKASPALRALDYDSPAAIVLAVDTSWKAVGFYLFQEDPEDAKKKYYARFESITLNDREARFSQPKRELFGLLRALHFMRYWLLGCRKLVVETDAKYLKGMLNNPDAAPNATINRWIETILMYHFTLRHKSGKTFGPDGLSRRDRYPGDPVHETPIEFQDEIAGPPDFEYAEGEQDEPLDIEEFKDQIDNRGGYLQGVARSYLDIQEECSREKEKNRVVREGNLATYKSYFVSQGMKPETASVFAEMILPEEKYLEKEHMDDLGEYPVFARNQSNIRADERLKLVRKWLDEPFTRPEGMNDKEYLHLIRFARQFFVSKEGKMYKRAKDSKHKLVVEVEKRMYIITAAHDSLGHKGQYATCALIEERFWWPGLEGDVNWFVKSCDTCQKRQKEMVRIPPAVTYTPSIFQQVHVDTINMTPKSNGCGYILHARCGLSSWPEGQAVRSENAKTIARWLFEDIVTRWGCLELVVSDNAGQYTAVVDWLKRKYGIRGVRISPYNSKANGKIERPHFDFRESLAKACGGDLSKWYWFVPHVLWAERITVRKGFGCSPFFMVTGAQPILPFDVTEATWLIKPPSGPLSTEELIGLRARALAKHQQHVEEMRKRVTSEKRKRMLKDLEKYKHVIKDYVFERGDLVLVRNSAIKMSLDRKMYDRYLGPLVIMGRSRGGAYAVAEMDGSVFDKKVAAFRVIPYFARRKIKLPDDLEEFMDVSRDRLDDLINSEDPREVENDKDFSFSGIRLRLVNELNEAGDENELSTESVVKESGYKEKIRENEEKDSEESEIEEIDDEERD